jgi:hypothetical protein
MSEGSLNLPQKRGIYVIFITIIVIMLFIAGQMFNDAKNFDNENVNGLFIGTVSFPDKGLNNVTFSFDGQGKVTGTLTLNNNMTDITGSYICQGSDIEFSLQNKQLMLVCIGKLNSDFSVIGGEAQLIIMSENPTNGTFFITRI